MIIPCPLLFSSLSLSLFFFFFFFFSFFPSFLGMVRFDLLFVDSEFGLFLMLAISPEPECAAHSSLSDGDNERCTIAVQQTVQFSVTEWSIRGGDYLTVGGAQYSDGDGGALYIWRLCQRRVPDQLV